MTQVRTPAVAGGRTAESPPATAGGSDLPRFHSSANRYRLSGEALPPNERAYSSHHEPLSARAHGDGSLRVRAGARAARVGTQARALQPPAGRARRADSEGDRARLRRLGRARLAARHHTRAAHRRDSDGAPALPRDARRLRLPRLVYVDGRAAAVSESAALRGRGLRVSRQARLRARRAGGTRQRALAVRRFGEVPAARAAPSEAPARAHTLQPDEGERVPRSGARGVRTRGRVARRLRPRRRPPARAA